MNNDRDLDLLIKQMAAGHQPELPSPGLIWWRAQLLRKQAEQERIERPAIIMRMVSAAVCVLVVLALWLSQGSTLWSVLTSPGLLMLLPFLAGGVLLTAVVLALLWRTSARV
jgi:hypothetical protein